ncbi:hypothetical protein I3843_07G088900 [Carya illinoinensis]|nr:hypothetical protein I3843_07G088900 [Carya illinoinensis]
MLLLGQFCWIDMWRLGSKWVLNGCWICWFVGCFMYLTSCKLIPFYYCERAIIVNLSYALACEDSCMDKHFFDLGYCDMARLRSQTKDNTLQELSKRVSYAQLCIKRK